jgi:transcriptional regulator with XRE-family HTH domain
MDAQATANGTTGKPRLVTVNQVVAWNMAYYRRAAGMKQQDVADRLGWTARTVSEAERSWDSQRTREFDAQLLADLAAVFGVPVMAFFLPPEGHDGQDLFFPDPAGEPLDMTALMWLALHDRPDESEVLTAYRRRLRDVTTQLLDPQWAAEVARWLDRGGDKAAIADRAAALRTKAAAAQETAAALAAEMNMLADELEKTATQEQP